MPDTAPQPLTVSELTRQIRDLLETNFDRVLCVGEISNLIRARSGHVYFTLKDEQAQISAVMWKSRAERLKFDLHDGLEIVVTGPIEVYPPRGSYQMIVEQAFPQGMGPLELAFRQLQEKLAAEGLFDPSRKRPLPPFPRKIALVTSATGAAVRDMLQVLTRRCRLTDIVVVPVPVQGATAAPQIAAGIAQAARIPGVEVIITGRGGGSLEDLWPFNEEIVARAIYHSPIPVISAVGHEIDVSIADLVADRRALTPTEAAEFAVPNQQEFQEGLRELQKRLQKLLLQKSQYARHTLEMVSQRRILQRPHELLSTPRRQLDDCEQRLSRSMQSQQERAAHRLQSLAAQLDALSPLKVLARGYSLTTVAPTDTESSADQQSRPVIHHWNQVQPGQQLWTRLAEGEILSTVVESRPVPPESSPIAGRGSSPAVDLSDSGKSTEVE